MEDSILFKDEHLVWYDFLNPSDEDMESISKHFQLNYNTVLDSIEPGHLPKIETHDDKHFIICRFYSKSNETFLNSVREFTNKIAIFYDEKQLITIHQSEADFLHTIQERYLQNKTILNSNEIVTKILWFSAYTFLDPIFKVSERINSIESSLFSNKLKNIDLNKVYELKRESSTLKRVILVFQEMLAGYTSTENDKTFIQDVKEMLQKLVSLSDQNLEDNHNIVNTYLSLSSKKTNDVMQLLTVFSAFFLPLTFIVGWYGMNFKYMPELNQKYAYPLVLVVCVLVVIIIFVWFRKRKIL